MSWFILMMLLLCCCSYGGRGASASLSDSDTSGFDNESDRDMTDIVMEKADSAMAGMTLEQRVGQCFMPAIYASADAATVRRLRSYISDMRVGGIVLLRGDLESAARLAEVCADAEVPLFVAIDAEWGLGMRLEDAPDFPRNGRISGDADESLLYDYGREVARECRRVGIGMVLGPVIDVAENPRGVIGSRSFGGDPVRVADLGVAYAKGLESGGVISVAKHFPGHGSPLGDSHMRLPVIERSLHQLDSIDLYPFRTYINSGLSAVMVGHLAVPAVDPQELPAAVSPAVIGDLLRGELGFHGLVLTDALNMKGAEGHTALAALAAGADIVVAPADTKGEIAEVMRGLKSGEAEVAMINDRCRRILFYKYLAGIQRRRDIPIDGLREDVSQGADSISRRLRKG